MEMRIAQKLVERYTAYRGPKDDPIRNRIAARMVEAERRGENASVYHCTAIETGKICLCFDCRKK